MNWKILGLDTRILGGAFSVLLIVFAAKSMIDEHDAKVRLEAELKATKQLLTDKDRQMDSINQQMQDRDKKLTESIKQIEELKRRPLPVKEIVKEIPKYVPITEPTLQPNPDPAKPPVVVLDVDQLSGLRDYYLECHEKTLKLQACTDNEEDWKKKELTWQEKEKILEQQRDAAIRTVKGGGFWTRFKRNAKWIGVTAVTGVVAYEVGKSNK